MFVGPGPWSRLPPSASVGMFSYQADLVLAICYLQVRQAAPPPTHPPTATFLLHGSLEGRPMAGNSLSPWSSIVDSVCHSVLTRLWSQAQLRSPGEGRDEERPGVRGWGVGGQRASVTSPPSELGSLGAITHRSLGALRHSASGTE